MGSIRLRYYCIGLATWRRDEGQQRKISRRGTFHRHSGGSRAKVRAGVDREEVSPEIRDYGQGILREVRESFKTSGNGVAVGLAGIR
jgi:hypothetical protein